LRLLSSLDFDGNVNQAIFLLIHTFVSFTGGCVILLGLYDVGYGKFLEVFDIDKAFVAGVCL